MGKTFKDTRPKCRRYWNINPKTKVKDSKKEYERSALKREVKDFIEEIDEEFLEDKDSDFDCDEFYD